jgi:hypothetical protein
MASAPTTDPREAEARKLVCRDVSKLAPKFNIAVRTWIADANASGKDLEINETTRCEALGLLYFQLGRTKAPTVWKSWHAYGLAVDVVSHSRGWAVWPEWNGERFVGGDPTWYEPVVEMAKSYGMHWGGDWRSFKDCPHFQHHCDGMYESPSDYARQLYLEGGVGAVWKAVNAI